MISRHLPPPLPTRPTPFPHVLINGNELPIEDAVYTVRPDLGPGEHVVEVKTPGIPVDMFRSLTTNMPDEAIAVLLGISVQGLQWARRYDRMMSNIYKNQQEK